MLAHKITNKLTRHAWIIDCIVYCNKGDDQKISTMLPMDKVDKGKKRHMVCVNQGKKDNAKT